ncbi:MAG: D-2-hydroxyacid dehydrogenase [Sediminicola sp.]
MKVLANDGLSPGGIKALQTAGFEVDTTTVSQERLSEYINKNGITVLLVRSATKVTKDILDHCPTLKVIGRGGVGMDNIEVDLALKKGLKVINAPSASAAAVAELVFAHLYGGSRFLHDANRNMPLEGDSKFKSLKKSYSNGMELRGKTLGIIGFGRIGQETAKLALGIGMKVIYNDLHIEEKELSVQFYDGQELQFTLKNQSLTNLLAASDFISLHVPAQKAYVIGAKEFAQMKDGVGIINTARGSVLDEVALVDALDSGKVSFAGLDVFEKEPEPEIRILMHPKISLTPHIGAGTWEAQERIGISLASQIIDLYK